MVKPDDFNRLPPPSAQAAQVTRHRAGETRQQADWLAEEVPVALVFNGIAHAVMLASPHDLEDFALGFGLSEGLLAERGELYGVELLSTPDGIEVHMEVAAACEMRLKARRRNLTGRTGCGLCGTESLAQVKRALPQAPTVQVHHTAIAHAMQALPPLQTLQHSTGAAHAAAWCSQAGEILLLREDIGRHNALDKLLGALVKQHTDFRQGWLCITSRASFEMVQKSAMLGAGLVVAVSAPTSLAVRAAQQANLALAGFARGADLVAYTFPERFAFAATPPTDSED